MSVKAVSWALDEVRGVSPTQKLILIIMAEVASSDGTGSYNSVATIADKSGLKDRQVQIQLKALRELGLIRRGDQRHVSHYSANTRPTVYDMVMEPERRLSAIAAAAAGVQSSAPLGVHSSTPQGVHSSVVRGAFGGAPQCTQTMKPKEKPSQPETRAVECRDCGRSKAADEITDSGLCADCLPQPAAPRPAAQPGHGYQDFLRARNEAKAAREIVPNDFDTWLSLRPVPTA